MRTRSRSISRSWTPRLPRSSARAPSRSATRRPCGRWEMPWSRGCGPEGWRRRRHAPCRRPSWAPTPMAQSMFRRGPLCLQGPLWLTYLPLSAGARFSVRLALCTRPRRPPSSPPLVRCRHPHRCRRAGCPPSRLAAIYDSHSLSVLVTPLTTVCGTSYSPFKKMAFLKQKELKSLAGLRRAPPPGKM